MAEHETRPADGWVFIEPNSCDTGVVRAVGYGLDICDIGREAHFDDPKPIVIEALGYIVTKHENIIIKGMEE